MEQYGLIGYPLGHSFSRSFFQDKFQSEGIEAEYINFEIPDIDRILEVLDAHPDLRGFNVTIPYKQKIIPYLDEVSREAREIGAVNVVKVVNRGGSRQLIGYNSDVIGFRNSIEPLLRPHHRRALILGTGGASRAVHYALQRQLGIETVFVSRYERPGTVTYDHITAETMSDYPLIVNTTPLGMYPHVDECPPLPYEAMTSDHLLFDLIYNPERTRFMNRGAAQGAAVKNGLEMLLLQAIASWTYWNE
jgi:shikimate dehydrogenase